MIFLTKRKKLQQEYEEEQKRLEEAEKEGTADFEIVAGVLKKYSGASAQVVIPDGVAEIGADAFAGMETITDVQIPYGVSCIGERAFFGCSGIKKLLIPASVTNIKRKAFSGCSSIQSLTVIAGTNPINVEDCAFQYCPAIRTADFQRSLGYMGVSVFEGCSNLQAVRFVKSPRAVINDYAFRACVELRQVVIPDGFARIGNFAFENCLLLREIKLPATVNSIGESAFDKCCALTSFELTHPYKIYLGKNAFRGCISLVSLKLLGDVDAIHAKLEACRELRSVTLNRKYKTNICIFCGCKIGAFTHTCKKCGGSRGIKYRFVKK